MELFAITCTTCKSRLKVRDPAAIGQILACPKCGGMVMVKPPPAFSEAAEQKSDLPTATEVEGPALRFGETPNNSAFDVLDELLSDAPPRVKPPPSFSPPPAVPATPKPRFVGGPPVHRSATPPNTKGSVPALPGAPPTQQKTPPPTTAAPAAAGTPVRSKQPSGSEAPVPPAPREQTAPPSKGEAAAAASGPRNNYWLLMAGSVVLGIGLALAAVCAVILLRPTDQANAGVPSTVKGPAATSKKENVPSTSSPTVPSPVEGPQPATPATPNETPQQPPAIVAANSEPATAPAADPLGLTTTVPPPAAAIPVTDPLAKFDRILGGEDPLSKPPTSPAEVPVPATVDTTPPRPLAPRPPPRDVDVAKRLNDPLPGIETTSTPLAEFVQIMSDLSTIPITLEVPFPPATSESPIVLKSANTTVGKALSEALATLRLEYVISDDQLIVRRPEPSPFAPLPHEVKDLTDGDEQQMNDLVELLQAVVEPGAWGDGEGQGSITANVPKASLVIRQSRVVQFQVLIAVEKLRASRTPPLARKTPVNTTLFQTDSRLKQAGPRLVKPLSLNYSQPTRLVTILDRLGETAGLRILVDWHDVATAGWNPAGEGTLVASNQPLVEALESLLTPLDLTFRIIDGQTLQVVTPARLNDLCELEVYKVADLIVGETTGETLVAKTRAALGDGAFIAGGGNGEIRYDDAGKCLLSWLSQPKQRELEVLLAKWRADAAK